MFPSLRAAGPPPAAWDRKREPAEITLGCLVRDPPALVALDEPVLDESHHGQEEKASGQEPPGVLVEPLAQNGPAVGNGSQKHGEHQHEPRDDGAPPSHRPQSPHDSASSRLPQLRPPGRSLAVAYVRNRDTRCRQAAEISPGRRTVLPPPGSRTDASGSYLPTASCSWPRHCLPQRASGSRPRRDAPSPDPVPISNRGDPTCTTRIVLLF